MKKSKIEIPIFYHRTCAQRATQQHSNTTQHNTHRILASNLLPSFDNIEQTFPQVLFRAKTMVRRFDESGNLVKRIEIPKAFLESAVPLKGPAIDTPLPPYVQIERYKQAQNAYRKEGFRNSPRFQQDRITAASLAGKASEFNRRPTVREEVMARCKQDQAEPVKRWNDPVNSNMSISASYETISKSGAVMPIKKPKSYKGEEVYVNAEGKTVRRVRKVRRVPCDSSRATGASKSRMSSTGLSSASINKKPPSNGQRQPHTRKMPIPLEDVPQLIGIPSDDDARTAESDLNLLLIKPTRAELEKMLEGPSSIMTTDTSLQTPDITPTPAANDITIKQFIIQSSKAPDVKYQTCACIIL
jgi:hypothetical protein